MGEQSSGQCSGFSPLQKSSYAELRAKYLVKPLPHHLAGDVDIGCVGCPLRGIVPIEGHKVDVTLCSLGAALD